ncbi:MAG: nucleotidyltransferase domain-containing protein [Flavobacteriales bacterium]|nr:nucleotidyltransferase domain-containing protein [Flavobacteriales bacterium]
MKEKINQYISQLEQEKDIHILLACETGSRAWGFPSPDSDFDVRIIYKHKKDWYLTLSEKKDSIERFFENNEIDISGWDLRKSLRLLYKSNASLIERIQSPIIYKSDDVFMLEILDHAKQSYSRIAAIHHYLNLSLNALEGLDESGEYKLKKFFYALRSATACLWILNKEDIPPIEFPKMLNGLDIPDDVLNRIYELIEFKSFKDESYMHSGEETLFTFMRNALNKAKEERHGLPGSNRNMDQLNAFFLKSIS